MVFREPIMRLFVTGQNKEIVALGSGYLGLMALFYLFPGFTNGFQGYFRGRKCMKMTLLGTFIQTSLRAVFVYILTPHIGLNGVAGVACAIGWSMMLLVEIPYYFYIAAR